MTINTEQEPHLASRRETAERIDLTAAERNLVAVAARALSDADGSVDSPDWVTAAQDAAADLPGRLRRRLRAYRSHSGRAGTLLISGLPTPSAPHTPTVAQSVERNATDHAAITAMIALSLGELAAFRNEKGGALIHNVVPVPGNEHAQSNAGSTDTLNLHVENAFHPRRPDYVALYCVRADHARVAGTTVSSIRRALIHLDKAVIAVLTQPRYVTAAPPSFATSTATEPGPVLFGDRADPDVRVDFSATTAIDPDAAQALDTLRRALELVAESPVLLPGQMIFVDNRIVLHGRSVFRPRYDGADRWLHRVYLHLDARTTRPYRPADTLVLS